MDGRVGGNDLYLQSPYPIQFIMVLPTLCVVGC